jgi:hypothetical protein
MSVSDAIISISDLDFFRGEITIKPLPAEGISGRPLQTYVDGVALRSVRTSERGDEVHYRLHRNNEGTYYEFTGLLRKIS